MNLKKTLRYFSLSTIKVHDEYTRTQERYRLATWSAITNGLSKGMGMLVMLISIKLTIPYLGAERFGVWLTIASFSAMLSFLDLGAGNALTNYVAYSAANDPPPKLQTKISGGIGILFIIGLTMSISLAITASIIPWENIIRVSSENLHHEIKISCILFGGIFGIQLFTNGLQKIFAGLQKTYIVNIISIISNIVVLIALYLNTKHEIEIYYLLCITLGLGTLLNCTPIIFLVRKNLFTLRNIDKAIPQSYKPLLSSGGLFFALQIGTMIGWGADSLIIASTLGATQVATFAVTQKLFQLASQPLSIMNTPLWSAYADAHARRETNFIKITLIRSLIITAIAVIIFGLTITVWGNELSGYWTNNQLKIPSSLLLAFFIWTCCESMGNAFSMFLNGCSIVKPQLIAVATLVILSIPLKFICIKNFGITGMIAGFTILYLLNFYYFIGIVYKNQVLEAYEGKR